ncbi:MAG: hypothetical protein WB792_06990 [Desulfobacterales bacterium]
MKFAFVCPKKQKAFESASFEIIGNKGITLDVKGNKFLDAKVALDKPCPFCGEKHVYHVRELSCPFGSSEKEENPVKEDTHG